MRYFFLGLKVLVFAVLLVFAMHNAEPVTLRFFLDYVWQAPLALILLVFFIAGALFGLFAATGHILTRRRELIQLRKTIKAFEAEKARMPAPDAVIEPPRDVL
ncbi:LapA family protein [Chitinibacteraceae bacterium HSL-7]